MTDHLSPAQITKLCVSALPEDELAAAAVHTADCESCDERFVTELKRQREPAPFNFTLEPEFWFRHDHLDFDLLVALADKTLDDEMEEIIQIHLRTCANCREDVRSFLASGEATAGEMNVSYGPTYYEPGGETGNSTWWQHLQTKPAHAMAAIVLLAVALLIGVIAIKRSSGGLEANEQYQANGGPERSPDVFPSPPAPNVVSSPSRIDDTAIAVLKDAGGDVTIDRNGRVKGMDLTSENSRQYIARAFVSERLEPPDVLRHLAPEQSTLRGNEDGPQQFRLLYPARTVVIESRPVFRWESLPGASGYRVYVLDADSNHVSQSEELAPTATQWRAPAPLRRGQVFSWVVTAVVDGKKVVSPSASAPEMKFAVLSTADFQELNRLKEFKSHLALGVFYARTGLLEEAEREFENLTKLNPQSELPRKLLQSVRNIRQGN